MDQPNKLQKFQAAVFAEIDTKTKLIKQEAEDFKNSELEKNRDMQLLKSYNEIQKNSQDIRKKLKREVAKFGLDCKRNVLIRRNEIKNRTFDNVTEKLFNFYNSADYNEYILAKLQSFAKANSLADVEIHVSERDYLNAQKLKDAYSLPCTFIEDKSIKLGGFILINTKDCIYFDETLTNILAEQKEYFIKNSGLFL
ncbi:MAG: hypothetical protein WAX04_13640 [Oscillospiraceae bacterium]